ncbi:hypothetical protein [Ferruginibacter sp. SUN106]|uniref:hypothetical protein n=1 Tax=Ferruginibacter sp. SUN106 TaxID=2978348 RepID=UPI003D36CD12
MIETDLKLLDKTIQIIKSKNDNNSFSVKSLHEFELALLICLDLTRYELQQNAKISDLTASILSKLFAFQCFEFYYRDFPEIYLKTSVLFMRLNEYNEKLKSHDLQMNDSTTKDWINELNLALAQYLN